MPEVWWGFQKLIVHTVHSCQQVWYAEVDLHIFPREIQNTVI